MCLQKSKDKRTCGAIPPLSLAQDLQGTLDNTTPEGPGVAREWTPEWPHHPSQAEIDDAGGLPGTLYDLGPINQALTKADQPEVGQ